MSDECIDSHFEEIKSHASDIETTDMIEIFTDSINEPSPYHSDDMNYESIKELRIYTKADVHIITAVFSDNRCSNRFFLVSAGIFVG